MNCYITAKDYFSKINNEEKIFNIEMKEARWFLMFDEISIYCLNGHTHLLYYDEP